MMMEMIILICIVIIVFLICYLFFVKRDLLRIQKNIRELKDEDSNLFIHKEVSMKELSDVIHEINLLMYENKKIKIEVEQKNNDLKKMMTNISHDLKTPLTSALGYIDMILKEESKDKKKDLKIIEARLKRLEELIHSFFEFSKMVSHDNQPELSEVNLIGTIEECIAHYYDDFQKQNREIIFSHEFMKYKMISNKQLLIRIFDNLIGNAYKHGIGILEITVTQKDIIEIVFSNPLCDKNIDIDHIFDEFYTIDMSRTKGNTGLGLAIAKEFTERLQGTIQAKKRDDKLDIIIRLS